MLGHPRGEGAPGAGWALVSLPFKGATREGSPRSRWCMQGLRLLPQDPQGHPPEDQEDLSSEHSRLVMPTDTAHHPGCSRQDHSSAGPERPHPSQCPVRTKPKPPLTNGSVPKARRHKEARHSSQHEKQPPPLIPEEVCSNAKV